MEGIVRIGTVSDISISERTVRVFFPDVSIVSGWLKVVKSVPSIHVSESVLNGDDDIAEISNDAIIAPWMPNVGDTVLCLYDSGFNSDGYVLGGL